MKRSKRIYILLGVLAVACIATFGVMQYEEKQEQIRNSDEIILELDSDSVDSLSWEYDLNKETKDTTASESYDETETETESTSGTVALAFHKDENWLYDDDEAFPVDEEKIASLLEQFQSFGVSFVIEDVEDYGQYGLDDPICTIRLTAGEEEYEIQLGNYSNMDSQRYVSIGDGNVYLAASDPMDQFELTLRDMIKHDDTPTLSGSAATVTQIQFEGAQNYSISYDEDNEAAYGEDDVYFTEGEQGTLPLDASNISSYLSTISYLDLTDYVTYNVTEEELETYGLDDPLLSVSVDYTYENEEEEEVSETFVLHVSRDPEEIAAAEKAASGDDTAEGESVAEANDSAETDDVAETVTAYARVGESQIIYQITSADYEALMAASVDDLRHQEVFVPDFGEAYQVDISLEGKVYSLTMTEEDEEQTWYYQDEEISVSDFKLALNNLTADGFTDDQPAQQEEISLTVYLNNENYPKILIELYRYDGKNCLAVVDGEPLCFTARSGVVDLIESVQAIVLN